MAADEDDVLSALRRNRRTYGRLKSELMKNEWIVQSARSVPVTEVHARSMEAAKWSQC